MPGHWAEAQRNATSRRALSDPNRTSTRRPAGGGEARRARKGAAAPGSKAATWLRADHVYSTEPSSPSISSSRGLVAVRTAEVFVILPSTTSTGRPASSPRLDETSWKASPTRFTGRPRAANRVAVRGRTRTSGSRRTRLAGTTTRRIAAATAVMDGARRIRRRGSFRSRAARRTRGLAARLRPDVLGFTSSVGRGRASGAASGRDGGTTSGSGPLSPSTGIPTRAAENEAVSVPAALSPGTSACGAMNQLSRHSAHRTLRPAAPIRAGSTWYSLAQDGQVMSMTVPKRRRALPPSSFSGGLVKGR